MNEQLDKKFIYVDNPVSMGSMVSDIKASKDIAIDTEADSLYHYYHKICLIQLTIGQQNYIIDPLAKIDLKPFLNAVSAKPLILHDAGYDLRMMRSSFGFVPENKVFDTMLAARLLGYERFGLSSLVEDIFGVIMPKGGQKSDWSRRPLLSKQLEYASEDTFYLHRLADMFHEKLIALGRESWHEEWCRKTVEAVEEHKFSKETEDSWRIKGSRFLTIEALTQLREIWKWRELESQKEDIPPFKIMPNHLMLKLSVWAAGHGHKKLSSGPKLPRTCRGRRLEELKKAISIAYNMDKSDRPVHPKPKRRPSQSPQVNQICDELKTECDRIAEELSLSSQVIASRSTQKSIATKRTITKQQMVKKIDMMHWQANLLEPAVKKIFEKYPES